MKLLTCALVAGMLMGGGPARAATIDLSTWTCRQFQSASRDDVSVILAWLDGYYKGEDDPPIINTEQFVANAKKLGDYCAANPDVGLITATDTLFQKP